MWGWVHHPFLRNPDLPQREIGYNKGSEIPPLPLAARCFSFSGHPPAASALIGSDQLRLPKDATLHGLLQVCLGGFAQIRKNRVQGI